MPAPHQPGPNDPSSAGSAPLEGGSGVPSILQMRGISKHYPGVRALTGADLDVRAGEVHVLLGENGAGNRR